MFVLIHTCTFVDQSDKHTSPLPPPPTHTHNMYTQSVSMLRFVVFICLITLQHYATSICIFFDVDHFYYCNISSCSEKVFPLIY